MGQQARSGLLGRRELLALAAIACMATALYSGGRIASCARQNVERKRTMALVKSVALGDEAEVELKTGGGEPRAALVRVERAELFASLEEAMGSGRFDVVTADAGAASESGDGHGSFLVCDLGVTRPAAGAGSDSQDAGDPFDITAILACYGDETRTSPSAAFGVVEGDSLHPMMLSVAPGAAEDVRLGYAVMGPYALADIYLSVIDQYVHFELGGA